VGQEDPADLAEVGEVQGIMVAAVAQAKVLSTPVAVEVEVAQAISLLST
jgi:hypothetical protein